MMSKTPEDGAPSAEPAHDILAAEGFEMPASDPTLSAEQPHDVLAAEGFEVPGGDPVAHVEPAHDVLAAEEFAVPGGAPGPGRDHADSRRPDGSGPGARGGYIRRAGAPRTLLAAGLTAAVAVLWRRRR